HHQEDRAGAGQDGADQAQIHPAPREKEGGLTVKLFKGHYTRSLSDLGNRSERARIRSPYAAQRNTGHPMPRPFPGLHCISSGLRFLGLLGSRPTP
ncbi:MAG: hypothetical protein ACREYE_11960, partial [Gammaproteobacteria bacterium]